MQSPIKRITVYDLETGGFDWKLNSITEFAGVAIENETLDIVEEFSVVIKPYLDLNYIDDNAKKEAKTIFENLAKKDEDTNIKSLKYRNSNLTLKTLEPLIDDIELFLEQLKQENKYVFTYEEYLKIKDSEFGHIAELYFNQAYNSQALEVTHISIEMLVKQGIEKEEAFQQIKDFFERHTIGNSRPVISGHNIEGFDNDFMIKIFKDNNSDFFKTVNLFALDTLNLAHLKWFDMPSFSLGSCSNEIGLTLKEAHRALADTIANAKFLIKMLKNLRGEGDQKSTYKRKKYRLNY